ncbi:hypothetical protein FRC12_009392 [Ceratobasidium sp. 428]|nr:hypothetical protein FRC12_009392 [Ceratobasidium sp. 428]
MSFWFKGLNPNFSLRRLACPRSESGAFWSFLQKQSSIRTLEFPAGGYSNRFVNSVPREILPNLNALSGSVDELVIFSQIRPVSTITIIEPGVNFTVDNLVRVLDSAPLESITFYETRAQITLWGRFLRISPGEFAKSLRIWTVVDRTEDESFISFAPGGLSNFQALEEFRIVRFNRAKIVRFKAGTKGDPTQNVTEWLGEWSKPETWRSMIPSLRVVIIYGEQIL